MPHDAVACVAYHDMPRHRRTANLKGFVRIMAASPDRTPPNDALTKTTAVLLIAHGSRRPEANQELVEVARRLRSQSDYAVVEVSYLELAEPTILDAGRRCVDRGAECVLMLPYFLSAGTHVTADLERYRSELATRLPSVEFRLCAPLGLHPLMTEIVLDRLRAGLIKQ